MLSGGPSLAYFNFYLSLKALISFKWNLAKRCKLCFVKLQQTAYLAVYPYRVIFRIWSFIAEDNKYTWKTVSFCNFSTQVYVWTLDHQYTPTCLIAWERKIYPKWQFLGNIFVFTTFRFTCAFAYYGIVLLTTQMYQAQVNGCMPNGKIQANAWSLLLWAVKWNKIG